MKLFVFLVSCCVAISALSVEDAWTDFKREYSREYKSLREEKLRFEIFKNKLQMINEHNERFEKGEESYTMGINQFSDLTQEEFKEFLGLKKPQIEFIGQFEAPLNYTAPASIDWRTKGAVLSVKNQGNCGSCWAFSAIGAVEGQNAIKHNNKNDLSEQELLDCSASYHNGGCKGGYMFESFLYIRDNGISTFQSYPYTAKQNKCAKAGKARSNVKVTGYKAVARTESALQAAVASIGPISIGIDADKISAYRSGVFDNPNCGKALDHGVLAVGYGTEGGKDYWLVKNSWGSGWGENGYIKMRRNSNNQCGIASEAAYPVLA